MDAPLALRTAPRVETERHPSLAARSGASGTEVVQGWLRARFGPPTRPQLAAWNALRAHDHVLVAAPTGTGKTLAALAPVLAEMLDRPAPGLRALFVAPLRALCHDLETKLNDYLADLALLGPPAAPHLRAAALTGDTPLSRRRRQRGAPPAIVVTTPESLALWLSHPDAGAAFRSLRWLIIDEVHLLAPSKRGADLALSLERADRWADRPPRRIGLSATLSPLHLMARWLGGSARPVEIVHVPAAADWELEIEYLPEARPGRFLAELLPRLEERIAAAQTTLVFANVRSLAERLAWCLRQRQPDEADRIAVHHSALAPARRRRLEAELFAGDIRVVISSTSLEAGVDIGTVDQVLMVHAPGGTARLLQRLGRASHRPGGRPRGVVFVTSTDDLLETVVSRAAGQDRWLEPLAVPDAPLDVLCQQLVGLALGSPLTAAGLFDLARAAVPFQHLDLADFARCLDFLTGGNPAQRTPARLRWDDHRLGGADRRLARLYRQNAGTIVTEPVTTLHGSDGLPIGTVSSGFADGLRPGDRLLLAGRSFQIAERRPDHLAVEEVAAVPRFTRWLDGSLWPMSLEMARRLWRFREQVRDGLIEGQALDRLRRDYGLDVGLASALLADLTMQEQVSEIPASDLLVESVPLEGGEVVQHALHLPFPPIAAAAIGLVAARRLFGQRSVQVFPGRLGCLVAVGADMELDADRLRTALSAEQWERDLTRIVVEHDALARRFHAAATTGLMLLRQPLGRRVRVGGRGWAARRLMHWLRATTPHHPLYRQALKETLTEDFHLPAVLEWLGDLPRRHIRQRWLQAASPLAERWAPAATLPLDLELEDVLRAAALAAPRGEQSHLEPVARR